MRFSWDQTRRIAKTVRESELSPKYGPSSPTPPDRYAGMKLAIVTTAVTASGSGLGKGKARLQLLSRDSSDNVSYAAMSQDPVTVYSADTTGIAVNTLIGVVLVDGYWFIVWQLCASS